MLHVKRLNFTEFTKLAAGRAAHTTATAAAAQSVPFAGVLRVCMAGEGGVINLLPPYLVDHPSMSVWGPGGLERRVAGEVG